MEPMSKSAPDARTLTWCRPVGGIDFETTKELRWEIGRPGSGVWMPAVPPGFRFQASIPRPLRWLWSPLDRRYLRAACLHDYGLHVLKWDRVSAAAPFASCLQEDGVHRWQALAFTVAVIAYKWWQQRHQPSPAGK
jgi:hypothetical protein